MDQEAPPTPPSLHLDGWGRGWQGKKDHTSAALSFLGQFSHSEDRPLGWKVFSTLSTQQATGVGWVGIHV